MATSSVTSAPSTSPTLSNITLVQNRQRRIRKKKLIIIIIIIALVGLLIAFILLYIFFTTTTTPNRQLTGLDTPTALGVQTPAGAQLIDSTANGGEVVLPPAFVTIFRAAPTSDLRLIINPSPEYRKGAIIRIVNNSFTGSIIPAPGSKSVTINSDRGLTRNIRPQSSAALLATDTNKFILIKSSAVDRKDIRTQRDVNDIQKAFDPLGITYRYFFEGVYYVRNGSQGTYSTPVTTLSNGAFSYVDEEGVFVQTTGISNTIGAFDRPPAYAVPPSAIISIIQGISYLTPNDPINNWLRDIDNKLNNVRDRVRSQPPLPTQSRNPIFLVAAGLDLIIIIGLSIYYSRIR